jgi:uncharacterized protein YqgC (DUF456 family)
MVDWLYYVLLAVVLLTGLLLNLFSLPGNWLMLLAVTAYAWLTGWRYVGLIWLVVLLVVAIAGEVVEFFAAGAGAKKAGGTLWGVIGALLGGVVGSFLLTGLVPIPIIGTLVGLIAGTFLGAMGAELLLGKGEVQSSAVIGVGAAKGRFYGTLWKLAFGVVILIGGLAVAIPIRGKAAGVPGAPTPAPPVGQPAGR